MKETLTRISEIGRRSAQKNDWDRVRQCANEILLHDSNSPEGHFLMGLVEKAWQHPRKALAAFKRALDINPERYDAAIELATQYIIAMRHGEAAELMLRYESQLDNSPRYLDMTATNYTTLGLSERAWPLYEKALKLQPNVELFKANLAACGVYLGKIEEAKAIYESLLVKKPDHRRNHYHLARLERATDTAHIEQMEQELARKPQPPSRNIFIYYALGKELEDLERWDEAFHYYKLAGDAVTSGSDYQFASDGQLIDQIIQVCTRDWLVSGMPERTTQGPGKTPIFVLGLPRTGTTLTERILASHSKVTSIGESQFLEVILRRESGVESTEKMSVEMIQAVATKDMSQIASGYLEKVDYLLGKTPMFVDKLPYNFLYIGFIAKAFPDARIVCLTRNPMDTCFSMYKQPFTWAYRFSYNLSDLGNYYIAHQRLYNHWKDLLGDRIIEIDYESLVRDQAAQTRSLLSRSGLEFEEACLNFDTNTTASMTASSVQIREKVHARSVNRWRQFETQLSPLRKQLENAGISIN